MIDLIIGMEIMEEIDLEMGLGYDDVMYFDFGVI